MQPERSLGQYEAPRLLDLGPAVSVGADCVSGLTNASVCVAGPSVGGPCSAGGLVIGACLTGPTP